MSKPSLPPGTMSDAAPRRASRKAATIEVSTPDPRGGLGAYVKVARKALSDPSAPLVVTSTRPGTYSVTHRPSGAVVGFFFRLKDAKAALPELLPITDWDRGMEEVAHTPGLYDKVRAVERKFRDG
jgi:hypothetical protein